MKTKLSKSSKVSKLSAHFLYPVYGERFLLRTQSEGARSKEIEPFVLPMRFAEKNNVNDPAQRAGHEKDLVLIPPSSPLKRRGIFGRW
jgi:hypothetical protein